MTTASNGAYPVRIEGHLDESLSRWLWLVKWLLAIPHYVVLIFLWIAFMVVTVIAFFAILFTGRYPRGLFDFNVGVLRWSWRVVFYSYNALGTDKYPPFSLKPEEYPASLEVDYPERLSRRLVLVKWWLLVIPHFIIVVLLQGGIGLRHGGVVSALAFVSGIVLLFTGRYPKGLFDVIMGLNQWIWRVTAYFFLMRDEYPPFRMGP